MFLINKQRKVRQIYEAVKVHTSMFVTWLDFAVEFYPLHTAHPHPACTDGQDGRGILAIVNLQNAFSLPLQFGARRPQ